MKFVFDLYRYLFWGPFRIVVACLSVSDLYRLEKAFAWVAFVIFPKRREILKKELYTSYGRVWSSNRIHQAVQQSYRVYFAAKFRLFLLPRLNASNISRYIHLEGKAHLNQALSKGKGVLILNPHFGPYMMIMPALGHRGYDAVQMALQESRESVWRKGLDAATYKFKFSSIEGNMPVDFINTATGIKAVREVYRALQNNRIVLFPSTGRGGTSFHTVTLMNRTALLTPIPFRIALKTKADLLPAFVFCKKNRMVVKLAPALVIRKEQTPEQLLESYAATLDHYIGQYPEHFLSYLFETRRNSHWDAYPFFEDFKVTREGENK